MESRWLSSIQYLYLGMYFLSLPAGAATVVDTRGPSAQSDDTSIAMIDFLSLELIVLVAVVLLALVVIARSGKAP
jgi:hypothetical protein